MSGPNRRRFLKQLGLVGASGVTDLSAVPTAVASNAVATQADATVVISDDIHHIGDGNYSGARNTGFREPAEGESLFLSFQLTDAQANANLAELAYRIRGSEEDNPIYINSRYVGATGNSPAYGELQRREVFPDDLFSGYNSFEVFAAETGALFDVDDFEISDIQLELWGLNAVPNPTFSYTPERPEIGTEVALDAAGSTDPDGSIVAYEWDLDGDGDIDATGQQVRYVVEQAPEASVTLYVTDDQGATESVTISVPVEFAFRRRSEKMSIAETLHGRSILSYLEDTLDADLEDDPEMVTQTLDALERAVNDGRVEGRVAEGALERHLLAEDSTRRILAHLGPSDAADTDLAHTTAKYVMQTAVDALLIIATIKAGAGLLAATMLEESVDYLLGHMIPAGRDVSLKDELLQAGRAETRSIVDRMVDGSIETADALGKAVEDAVEGLVDTFALSYRSWVELESYNAILETVQLPMSGLPTASMYGSLRDLDARLQPEEVELGLAGDTEAARSSVNQVTPFLTDYMANLEDNIETLGRIGDELNLYDVVVDWYVRGSPASIEALTVLAKALAHGMAGAVIDASAAGSGALAAMIVKVTHEQLMRSIADGAEVPFTHV